MNAPVLSVCLITYNHENYIRQAIESILMQKVNFSWELIIAEDCSTDNTKAILLEYKEKFPDFIQLILQKKNVGPAINWMDLMAAPKSKYIAYIEGDDYWIDENKLQKQVDFLENNPEYVISFHDTIVINENNEKIKESKLEENCKKDYNSRDLINGALIMPLTMCYRNVIKKLPKEFYHVKNGDTFLISLLGFYGKAKFQSEIIPAAYREHSGGVWSLKNEEYKLKNHKITFYHMFLYFFNLNEINIGVDFYFRYFKKTSFLLIKHYFKNKKYLKGFVIICNLYKIYSMFFFYNIKKYTMKLFDRLKDRLSLNVD